MQPPDPPEPPGSSEQPPRSFFGRFAKAVRGDWRSHARPAQIPPEDFSVLLLLAGRGAGKNWTASHYCTEQAASGALKRLALIGATERDARFTMVEGESGILAAARAAGVGVDYEPGKGQITWPSGCIARLFSADQPDSIRGTEHDLAWCDELAAWRRADETWRNLLLTMRIGKQPRIIVTTTPRPTRLVRDLVARDGQDGIVVRRMSTYDNRANLAPQFFAQLVRRFEGTRMARQELLAELLEDVPGALWNRDLLESTRVDRAPEHLQRVVIGVDPAGSSTEGADLTGIVVCGIGLDGEGYVLADLSRRGTPREWASAAIAAYHSLRADKIVIERNFGGEMAASTLASVDPAVPVKEVTSSRGKVLRAEPIGSMFEQKRAHIVGTLPELEDQMCSFTSDWNRARDGSPDRVDSMVFALTELMIRAQPAPFLHTETLLSQAPSGEFAPVAMPRDVQEVFAFAAVTETEPDTIATVYFSVTAASGKAHAVATILDWDLLELTPAAFGSLYSGTKARLAELHAATLARSTYVRWVIDPAGAGRVLIDEAPALDVIALADEELLQLSPRQRAVKLGSHLTAGRVKLAKFAHEKVVEFKGIRRNHLHAHLQSFGLASEQSTVAPLLAAAATGALDALRSDRAMDIWRRLGAAGGESDALAVEVMTPESAAARESARLAAAVARGIAGATPRTRADPLPEFARPFRALGGSP